MGLPIGLHGTHLQRMGLTNKIERIVSHRKAKGLFKKLNIEAYEM